MTTKRRVLITGSNGFIGSNLQLHLTERQDVEIVRFTREQSVNSLEELLVDVDFVFHLAGVNRPEDPSEFDTGNALLTQRLCDALVALAQKQVGKFPSFTPRLRKPCRVILTAEPNVKRKKLYSKLQMTTRSPFMFLGCLTYSVNGASLTTTP